ncbi:Rv1733c family protein [Nocardia arthritidis]|uniref:Uncharacterized protein n=1 Tax=Nocardia arthritidis TaxID=228602 RepID=A0A6G9YH38_9NOCA|nr:hypothetical protein [Nocardia arthritidis]QIS12508.1 hypothetical protein F5544_23245 [Nocardia arthritidis]
MSAYPSLALRTWRILPWSPNPLMRMTDRLESLVRCALLIGCLLAVPIAGAVGTTTYTATAARIHTENQGKTAVAATLLADPEFDKATHGYTASADWTSAGGTVTAPVPTVATATRGDRVTVWLGSDGKPVADPRRPSDAAVAGIGAAAAILMSALIIAVGADLGIHWVADRRRHARWDREWRQVNRPLKEDKQ